MSNVKEGTHKQKMDQVIDGLECLTTQEVESLLSVIEAFKVREEYPPNSIVDTAEILKAAEMFKELKTSSPQKAPQLYSLPGIMFDVKDLTRITTYNSPPTSPSISLGFNNDSAYSVRFESLEERDNEFEALRIFLHTRSSEVTTPAPLSKIPTCELVDELVNREGVAQWLVGHDDRYAVRYLAATGTEVIGNLKPGPAIVLEIID